MKLGLTAFYAGICLSVLVALITITLIYLPIQSSAPGPDKVALGAGAIFIILIWGTLCYLCGSKGEI
jgi:hypothetical protein